MLPFPFDQIPKSATRNHQINKGGILFRQGDKTRGLFFVVSGSVELQRFTQAGQSVTIHRARNGDTFAEASLFSECYHCDAITMADSHVIEVSRDVILEKFNSEPKFALAIAKRFAQQNQHYRRKLEILAIKNAEIRIFTAILEGLLTENVKIFASDIGLTHEAVYRGLAKLVDKGMLNKTARGKYNVVLKDP